MNSSFAEHLWWEHRLVAPYKGIQDSPGFWIPRGGFRIPKPRIPNSSIKISKIQQAKKILGTPYWISLHDASSELQANPFTVFFLSKIGDDFSRVYPNHQHLKMGKEGRTVYLYVDLYLSGWQRPINTRDRGFNHSTCLTCLTCTRS